ncbi:hypothetical protein D3878_01590 [Noviherbaspirillum sedimenti]|uniref:Uncharacterized protein n=2 Tax=Noviherbaspirillum sedimenti TaxID=2320865 RepID=A0A3A3FW52_9BURK|nr:hypothetical protein D3878_01590 [Noviherbaspirillum sedimenti]
MLASASAAPQMNAADADATSIPTARASSTSATPLTWSVTNLGAFNDEENSVATGINNAGKIVGFAIKVGAYYHRPFIYANGIMAPMLSPVQDYSIQPALINDGDMVVGYTYEPRAQDGGGPFIYSQGTYARLGGGKEPSGLNDAGKAVGNLVSRTLNPAAPAGTNPFITRFNAYLYFNGAMTDLTAAIGALSAYDINNQGDIVGKMPDKKGYFYRNGQVQGLGALPGDQYSLAISINDKAEIVGVSANDESIEFSRRSDINPTSGWRAFLYQNGAMTDLNEAGGFAKSYAFMVNNRGHVLGEAWKEGHRFHYVYRDGEFINLSDLPALKTAGWTAVKFYDMNDAGKIVGEGVIGGKVRALLLTPKEGG